MDEEGAAQNPFVLTEVEQTWRLLSWAGEAQWFAKQNERVLGGRIYSPEALAGTIRNSIALNWNLYLNLNPTKARPGAIKLDRSDVRFWRYIVVDIDPVESLAPPNFSYHKLNRGNIIFTGRGYHCWILVEPLDDFDRAERIMRNYLKHLNDTTPLWAPGWKVDTSCADLPRVVRVPGSINQKTNAYAHIESVSGGMISQAEYMEFDSPPPETVAIGSPTNFAVVLSALSMSAKRFLLSGSVEGDRHREMYHTIKSLHELGVPRDLATTWVLHGVSMCRGPDQDVLCNDAHRAIHRLYGGTNVLGCQASGVQDGTGSDGEPGPVADGGSQDGEGEAKDG